MKFEIEVHAGSQQSRRTLDLDLEVSSTRTSGHTAVLIDRSERRQLDWVEISPGIYSLLLDGRSYEARVIPTPLKAGRGGESYEVSVRGQQYRVEIQDPRARRRQEALSGGEGPQDIIAPMPGRIVKILVKENQEIEPGQGLLVMEAMKMQNELRAPRAGRVAKIYVSENVGVETGIKLLRLV
jgi:biotin carboxyl carrier protein